MDRELSSSQRRKKRLRVIFKLLIVLLAIGVSLFALRAFITPALKLDTLTVETTEIGTVEATIPGTGIVIPESEYIITSPITAKIEVIHHRAGDFLKQGESIFQLNRDALTTDYKKMLDEQAVNKNKINQLQLLSERTTNDLKAQLTIKEMQIQNLETEVDHEKALLKIGGGTIERVKQAQTNLSIAKIELAQFRNQIENQRKSVNTDLKSLSLQINIQDRNLKEVFGKLHQAEITSSIDGILTWVNDKVGTVISEGDELAKIADLRHYKVEGSVSESYANYLKIGGGVIVKINAAEIRGKIRSIQPAVQEGVVKFIIGLEDSKLLRSNLKVEIFVVNSIKEGVLRLKSGPALANSGRQRLYVISGNKATLRTVVIGESNYQYVEIVSGLKVGERVIVSDMQKYNFQDNVTIQN